MIKNYKASLAKVLQYEGGYSNNPKDPGGATMRGVTQATYDSFRTRMGLPKRPVHLLGENELQAIYQTGYWEPLACSTLSDGVDLVAFDAAVNSGVSRSRKWLKASMTVYPLRTIKEFCAHRLGFMRSLRTWSTFGRGWAKRVADVEATATKWASGADAPQVLKEASVTAKKKAQAHASAATVTGASAPTAGVAVHDYPWELWVGLGLIGILVLVFFIYWYNIHSIRAKAFEEVAKEA